MNIYLTEHPYPCHLDEEENSDVDNADEDDWDQELEYSREHGVPVQGHYFLGPVEGQSLCRLFPVIFFRAILVKLKQCNAMTDSQRKPNLNLGKVQIIFLKHVTVRMDPPPLQN